MIEFIEIRFSPTREFIKQKYSKKIKAIGGIFGGNDKFRFVVVPNTPDGIMLANDICHKFHLPAMQIIMRGDKLKNELASKTWFEIEWNGSPEYDYIEKAIEQFRNINPELFPSILFQ